jgi:hypothetical protein
MQSASPTDAFLTPNAGTFAAFGGQAVSVAGSRSGLVCSGMSGAGSGAGPAPLRSA